MQTATPRQSSGNPAFTTVGICLALGVIAFFLLTEHRAHFFGALPYLLLSFFPVWREKLPRPGPWMVRLKRLLAFPLYATVIWLAWVLGAQLDNDAVARLFVLLLLVALGLWMWRAERAS